MNDLESTVIDDVACETGRSFRAVETVYHLMVEVHEIGAALAMIKGELNVVAVDSAAVQMPVHLWDEINNSIDDVYELLEPIQRSMQRLVMGSALQ
jgi:hypothetical protein